MAQSLEHRSFRSWVVNVAVPKAISLFLQKNEGYPYEVSEFGSKAEIIELHRKYKKLRHAIWDGESLVGEQVPEVAMDMIGHLFLLIDAWEQENEVVDEAWLTLPEFTAEHWVAAYRDGMEELQDLEDLDTDG